MKAVVDANVLFSLTKETSTTNNILKNYSLKLLAPDFALLELYKYKQTIVVKSGITDFGKIIESLKGKVVFIDNNEYKHLLKEAQSLIDDPKDVAYLALALRFFLPIWSNDRGFKKQNRVPAFTTAELIMVLRKGKLD